MNRNDLGTTFTIDQRDRDSIQNMVHRFGQH